MLDGATAFRLSDTFGFPRELTAEILEEEGMTMDDKAFNEALEVQRKMARDARSSAQNGTRRTRRQNRTPDNL